MKKLKLFTLLLAVLFTVACADSRSNVPKDSSAKDSKDTIVIGVSPAPHADIAEAAKKVLEKEGINLEIKTFDDYVIPNTALAEGELNANFFQHEPYLKQFIEERNLDLVSVGAVHLEPMGVYSRNYQSLDELKEGDEIIIPNDPTNGSRALKLLEKNNIIKLDAGKSENLTEADIVENTKNLKFTALEAATIPRTYEEAAVAVINSNYALQQGLSPKDDAIVLEEADGNPYANIIAVRSEDKDNELVKKLMQAFQSEEVKKLIEENYNGEIIPAF